MRITSLILLLTILAFSGCCSKTQTFTLGCQDKCIPDTIVTQEKEYIEQQMEAVPEPPIPQEYDTVKIKINGKIYRAVDKVNAAIMSANVVSNKGYIETLENILYNLQKENNNQGEKNE